MAKKTIITGTKNSDPNLLGTTGDDNIQALNGNDTITGLAGNDIIDGGGGIGDTTVFSVALNSYAADNYSFQWLSGGLLQVSGTDGVDTLAGVEFLKIGDQTYSINGPVARSDGGSGTENQTISITNVLANDTSLQTGAALAIQKVGGSNAIIGDTVATLDGIQIKLGAGNSLVLNPGATWDYLSAGEILTRTFTYTIGNGTGNFATAKVNLTITGTNDAPVAQAFSHTMGEDDAAFAFTADFTDPDATDTHTITINTTGTQGLVVLDGNNFLYDPDDQFNYLNNGQTAADTFTYTVDDGHGGVDTKTVTVTINGSDDAPVVVPTGSANDVDIEDLNGDEILDILTTGSIVTVSLGDGDGTFQSPTQVPGMAGDDVVADDFNEDGILDIATSGGFNERSILVSLGAGDGTFASPATYVIGGGLNGLAKADVNADNNVDLIVANQHNGIHVLLGNGDGSFDPAVSYAAGHTPNDVTADDLNGDGRLDLVASNLFGNSLSVLFNNGDGTFQPDVEYPIGDRSAGVETGDLNGDGNADLIGVNQTSNSISVLLNNGDGTFQPNVEYTVGTSPASISVGDLNGDGVLDLVTANQNGHSVSILEGNGDGTFQSAVNIAAGTATFSTDIGDLNGDGKQDIVAGALDSNNVTVLINQTDFFL